MIDLSINYMGLKLKNPLIIGSCGLTNSINNIRDFAEKGAGAVVLKSIFEEQIRVETERFMNSDHEKMKEWNSTFDSIIDQSPYAYEEAMGYITNFAKEHTLKEYLSFISEVKKEVDIPVIASVNCVSKYEWTSFAKRIQDAGADAIELNVYVLPSDSNRTGTQNEQIYFDIISEVKKHVTIPVSLKIGSYFSGLANLIKTLSESGPDAIVLFNKPYNPDIDIRNLAVTSSNIFSAEHDYIHSLRWIASLSDIVSCDLAASTGIFDAETAIKQLLTGANAFQIASAVYKHGADIIPEILSGIEGWMKEHKFNTVEEFKGKLNKSNTEHPMAYDRVQFMKYYSKIE